MDPVYPIRHNRALLIAAVRSVVSRMHMSLGAATRQVARMRAALEHAPTAVIAGVELDEVEDILQAIEDVNMRLIQLAEDYPIWAHAAAA